MTLNSKGEVIDLETLGDVVGLLKTKHARDYGVDESVFHRNGIASIEVAATVLRSRGYEVETFSLGGVQKMRLLAVPAVGARKRKRDQGKLFELPSKTRGPYEDAA